MASRRGKAPREARIGLGEDLRIGRACEVFAALEEARASGGGAITLVIDGSAVSRVDAAGLQALAACVVRCRTAGTQWRWDNPAETLRKAVRAAGLDATLGIE